MLKRNFFVNKCSSHVGLLCYIILCSS